MILSGTHRENLEVNPLKSIAETFLNRIKKAGYKVGVYCNMDWYQKVLTEKLRKYDTSWIARYPADDNGTLQERLRPDFGVGWQYSSKAKFPGIIRKSGQECIL